jgi:hypothetical protein
MKDTYSAESVDEDVDARTHAARTCTDAGQGMRKGSCMQRRWAAKAGTGRHDEPYDPLVFPLYAMMSLPVSWALELLAAFHALYSAAPLRPAFPSLLLFLLCACVCAFGLWKEHMRMLSVRATDNLHLSSLLPLCSWWPALHRALDTRHWTRSSRSFGMHADLRAPLQCSRR